MLVHIAKWESKTNIVPYHICELVKDRIKNLLSRNRSAKVGDLPYTIRRLDDTSRFNIYGDVVIETNEADICLGGAWGTNGKVELRYQEDLRHTTIDVFAASGYEQEAKKAWGSLAQELSERNYASRIWEPESLPDGAPNTTFEPDCYPFNGTPDIFASIFREFVSANRDIPKTYIIDRDKNRVIAGICAGYAESVFLDSYPIPPACRIIVTIQPGGAYSRIRLELETPPLYVVSPFIDRFIEHFKKEGWLQSTQVSAMHSETHAIHEQRIQPQKHEMMHCNKWLIEQVFDRGKNEKELVEEWLSIRASKDYKDHPQNPLASMRTAISEERERRNQA